MKKRSPYAIVVSRRATEKAVMLQNLQSSESNRSVARCKRPKAVFIVHPTANKVEIKEAVEEIYRDRGVKVVKVNTLNAKPKARRVRGRLGVRPGFKKAIVTFEAGDSIETE